MPRDVDTRAADRIDRDAVWTAKRTALEAIFAVPRSPGREAELAAFAAAGGQPLQDFALWCALGPKSPVLPQVIEGDPTDGAEKIAWFDDPDRAVGQQARARCEALRPLTR